MNATFNIRLHHIARKNGEYPVLLKITINRKHKTITLPITVTNVNHFNSNAKRGKWIRKSDPDYVKKNNRLLEQLEKYEDSCLDLENNGIIPSHKQIINNTLKKESPSLIDYADKQEQLYKANKQINYSKHYAVVFNKLKDYIKKNKLTDLTFEDVNVTFLREYEAHLSSLKNNKNTIAKNFRIIRATMYNAAKEGIIGIESIPFHIFKIKSGQSHNKALTIEELDKVIYYTPKKNSLEWHAKNYFLFSYYCAGIRIGDLMLLKWNNIRDNRLEYKMKKNDKLQNIVLTEKAQKILELYRPEKLVKKDFIFPILDKSSDFKNIEELERQISARTSSINRSLKSLSENAEISTKITTHMARHTFSDLARQKGANIYDISKLLKHSNLKTTQGYLATLDKNSTDSVLNNL